MYKHEIILASFYFVFNFYMLRSFTKKKLRRNLKEHTNVNNGVIYRQQIFMYGLILKPNIISMLS